MVKHFGSNLIILHTCSQDIDTSIKNEGTYSLVFSFRLLISEWFI